VTTFYINLITVAIETYFYIYQQATQNYEEGDQSNGQGLSIGLYNVRRNVKVYGTKNLETVGIMP
jgi:hypothetical protein